MEVSAQEYAFAVLAFVGTFSAIRVVTTRNVVRGALYLVVSLASVGGVFLVTAAEFVAGVQILIYVGSIVILFLFGLMLTKAPIGRDTLDNQQRGVAAIVGLGVFAGLVLLIQDAFSMDAADRIELQATTAAQVGDSMFRDWVLPFEAVSFLLLAALIGAIVLARKDDAQ
ncbi:MAG: NADH-quinone oxidoreductase subunit J [Actinomycetota bacterium]